MDERKLLLRQLEREKAARKEAEFLLEKKSLELFNKTVYAEMQHNITSLLVTSASLPDAIPGILKTACEHLFFECGEWWELNETEQKLHCKNTWVLARNPALEDFEEATKQFHFNKSEGLPGQVWERQALVWLKDVTQDKNFPHRELAEKANLHTGFGFPVFFDEKIAGVFCFYLTRTTSPQPFAETVCKDISNQISIVMGREEARRKMFEGFESIKTTEALVEEYKKSKESAELANRTKSEFLANMSHELRTPLNTILGYTEMVQEFATETEQKEAVSHLEKVIRSAKHLLELINDILDMSKIEAGKMDIVLSEFQLDEFIKTLHPFIGPQIKERKNTFNITLHSQYNNMFSDELRIRQCLLNLLTNANKFTENGHITLDITSFTQKNEPVIQFTITDTGVGMTKEQLNKTFKSFSQGDSSTTRKFGGTGLGLFLTKRFCEMLGGVISVKSQENKGSVFTIVLPLRCASTDFTLETTMPRIKKTVLLMGSGEEEKYTAIKQNLQKANLELIFTQKPEEGLALAHQQHPDVILLDISTISLDESFMDQWAVISAIKKDSTLSKIPILVISHTLECGLSLMPKDVDFIQKPFDMKLLMSKIKKSVHAVAEPLFLIVEDDPLSRELLVEAIKRAEWKSIEATNGREALEQLKHHTPTVILLDLMMPEMDGFQVINELQKNEQWRDIPVIILTAKELSAEERTMLTKYTTAVYQKKGHSPKNLIAAIMEQIKEGEM